ncbi:adhesion G-protein coupled receptor G2 [Brachionichthys hirsutus]|uniref:adhesion G-protein coupled receptor G2 n=1 Tax=Brachionichthys hirsutus TaxID=412623 RepID=UPI003604C642
MWSADMNAPRAVSLCLQLLLCVLGSSVSSGASVSSSLWGQKIRLIGRPCVWQLQTGVVVPSLKELSVCMLLRLNYRTEWTGFVYKAPGQRHIELGLQGAGTHLTVWLFGKEQHLERELKLHDWYSVCLTWSGRARRLRVYINGTSEHEASVNSIVTRLTQNGTLTLGVSHYVDTYGEVKAESGNNLLGEIALFRMWAREWRPEELRARSCADGDVLSWDKRQWKHNCPPEPDLNLHCAWSLYKIKMWTSMFHSSSSENCSLSLKDITRNWLEGIFPRNLSVLNIFVSSPSFCCEVYVNVYPAADVEAVQANIAALLSLTFSQDSFNLTSDPSSISILPVELFPAVTEPPPTFSPHITASESVPTQSLTTGPANMSTTGEPLDINVTTVAADMFFRVTMTLSLTGSPSNPQDFMERWVKGQLEVNTTMIVFNLIIRANVESKLSIETDSTHWAHPDMKNCEQLVTISDLDNITVTPGNAAEVVDIIQDLVEVQLNTSEELSGADLDSVVNKLMEVVKGSIIKPAVGADIANVVSDILLSNTDITSVANRLLNLTELMGNEMDFQNESVSVTAPLLAVSMSNAAPDEFRGLTFGVSSISSTLDPEIFLSQSFVSGPIPDTEAAISLPSELNKYFHPGEGKKTRVHFNHYGTQKLFEDPLTTNATHSSWTLNSYIVSASIDNGPISSLKEGVVVTLRHQTAKHDVYRTPISEVDSHILTVISYLGCGISSIFLGITLLTYISFEKLRKDNPSKILINLSAALLGLNMVFLLNSWLASFSSYSLCIVTAATLHYFLLASFTWMGLEAVHMYHALVKVFNIYIPSYILKFCVAGWVSLVLVIDKDAYGSAVLGDDEVVPQPMDQFCWLQSDIFFYVTVVAFVLLILLCNMSMFIVVLIQIRQMSVNKPSANSRSSLQDLRAVASLTVLLGQTWAMAFFSFGPGRVVLMYLFTIFSTFQGFLVFLFYCLMKENVRKQWRIHLGCGRFRLDEFSGWSRTVTVGSPHNKNDLVKSDSVDTSGNRKDSGFSSGSSPNHSHKA